MSSDEFQFERPSWMEDLPRESKRNLRGPIVAEVGVHEQRGSDEFWKTFERVERENGDVTVRLAYYEPDGDSCEEQDYPATLPPDILNDLYHRARAAGIFQSRRASTDDIADEATR